MLHNKWLAIYLRAFFLNLLPSHAPQIPSAPARHPACPSTSSRVFPSTSSRLSTSRPHECPLHVLTSVPLHVLTTVHITCSRVSPITSSQAFHPVILNLIQDLCPPTPSS
jgi:hypothetical protein